MYKHFVYKLINSLRIFEHIGETKHIQRRYNRHTCIAGKFYGRKDLTIKTIKEFNNKKEAWDYQCKLQTEYGLETDRELCSKGGKNGGSKGGKKGGKINGPINGKISQSIIRICPHCNTEMKGSLYFRYHGDRCKHA